jgi:hypothetical protein
MDLEKEIFWIAVAVLILLAISGCGDDNVVEKESLKDKEAISCRDKDNGLHYWTHSETRGSCVVQCGGGVIRGLRCKNWKAN